MPIQTSLWSALHLSARNSEQIVAKPSVPKYVITLIFFFKALY